MIETIKQLIAVLIATVVMLHGLDYAKSHFSVNINIVKPTQQVVTIAPKDKPVDDRDALTETRIEGTEEFVFHIKAALKLLKESAPAHYYRVGKYVSSIEYTPKADNKNIFAYVYPLKEGCRMFFVSEPIVVGFGAVANRNLMLAYTYAGALVHEARHIEQYFVMPDMVEDEKRELDAVASQVEALKLIGASELIINNQIRALETRWWENHVDFDSPPPS
ncbi:MAG: hypothetical protein M1609_09515 [Firmicutes bacterium]|nr:hypothetical protein [Bacillota bacterium]